MSDDVATIETTEAPEAEAPLSIRDELSATLETIKGRDKPEVQQDPEEGAEQVSRSRDERGRFAKAEGAAEDTAPVEADPQPSPAALDEETTKATARWSQTDRDMLGKLPQEAREFVLRRARDTEADYSRKMNEVSEARRQYEPIDRLFAPHEAEMAAKGHTKASLIQTWYNAEKTLMDGGVNAAQFVANLMRGYRIDPSHVGHFLGLPAAGQMPEGQQQAQAATLPPEVIQTIQGLQTWQSNFERQQHIAAANRVMGDIQRFASETDSSGALSHPFFSEVENDMAVLANAARASGQEPVLSELYERAVWANPSIRDRMLTDRRAADEAQRNAAEQQRLKEARAKADKAKRAAASVTGAPGPGQAARQESGSIRDTLKAAYAEATSRV